MGTGLSEVQRENRVSLEGALQSIDELFFVFVFQIMGVSHLSKPILMVYR